MKLVLLIALSSCLVEANSWTLPGHSFRQPTRLDAATVVPPSPEATTDEKTIVLADEFITPDRDPRQYRMIRLANTLECLLVSDGLTEGEVGVEAASVHVQAGHFDDTIPGLAHFHEQYVKNRRVLFVTVAHPSPQHALSGNGKIPQRGRIRNVS